MKVLRAIGGFFAKIGRWIANTAWIQPLLIVGGIFGIIFSIPYIKAALEKDPDTTDYDYEYYKGYGLGLEEDGRADKLLSYFANQELTKIDNEFGKKFFVSFIRKDCSGCVNSLPGFKDFSINFGDYANDKAINNFKMYTIVVDTTDDDGEYPAQKIFKKNAEFFESLNTHFGTEKEYGECALEINKTSDYEEIANNLNKLATVSYETSSEFLTPLTIMYDSYRYETTELAMFEMGITSVFFDYTTLMSNSEYSAPSTATAKGQFLADCWNYEKYFDENFKK